MHANRVIGPTAGGRLPDCMPAAYVVRFVAPGGHVGGGSHHRGYVGGGGVQGHQAVAVEGAGPLRACVGGAGGRRHVV
jgi:hypothetical protein